MLNRINELSRKINRISPSTFPISFTIIDTPLLAALLPWAERSSSPKATRGANVVTLDGTVRPPSRTQDRGHGAPRKLTILERLENDSRRFASDFQRQKKELEVRVAEEKGKTKRDAERLAAQYQEEIDELYAAMRANTVASDEERAELLNRINELARRVTLLPPPTAFFARSPESRTPEVW
jgi:hypothetical protein